MPLLGAAPRRNPRRRDATVGLLIVIVMIVILVIIIIITIVNIIVVIQIITTINIIRGGSSVDSSGTSGEAAARTAFVISVCKFATSLFVVLVRCFAFIL